MTTLVPTLTDLSAVAWEHRERLDAAKKALAPDAELRALASAYIEAVYAWQRARHGKVRAKLSVASLLR